MKKNELSIASMIVLCAGLSACATGPQPLYYWGNYQPQVYESFKGETGQEEQIQKLQETQAKASATGKAVPPGFNAHVGLLYGQLGRSDEMISHLLSEKKLFPESATYIDFLLVKKPQEKSEKAQ